MEKNENKNAQPKLRRTGTNHRCIVQTKSIASINTGYNGKYLSPFTFFFKDDTHSLFTGYLITTKYRRGQNNDNKVRHCYCVFFIVLSPRGFHKYNLIHIIDVNVYNILCSYQINQRTTTMIAFHLTCFK